MSKRPRLPPGGHAQKAKWQKIDDEASTKPSALGKLLVELWAWGDISSPMVQRIADAAVADGATHKEVLALQELGSHGKHLRNVHQQLVAKVSSGHLTQAVSEHKIYMKKAAGGIVFTQHTMLLPREVFSTIYHCHKDVFLQRFCGGALSNIKAFWKAMRGNPAYESHPMNISSPEHVDKCIPLSLHGDAVPVANIGRSSQTSIEAYSFSSMLGKGSTIQNLFLIYLVYPKLVIKTATHDAYAQFMRKLTWSFYWLYKGVWPEKDEHGKPIVGGKTGYLADGWSGVLWGLKGDLDHMAKAMGLNHYASSSAPCICCQANDTNRPWTDARESAAWRQSVWDNQGWIRQHPQRHPLFRLPGVGVLAYQPDVMHCMYLGAYQYYYGSVLKFLTHHVMTGTPSNNLEVIWERIKAYWQVIKYM